LIFLNAPIEIPLINYVRGSQEKNLVDINNPAISHADIIPRLIILNVMPVLNGLNASCNSKENGLIGKH
tara:strand:+ start:2287 stop:2493 length:207 start_codon:yes stop_codon:yes gene_type:complete